MRADLIVGCEAALHLKTDLASSCRVCACVGEYHRVASACPICLLVPVDLLSLQRFGNMQLRGEPVLSCCEAS